MSKIYFHHCMDLKNVSYSQIVARKKFSDKKWGFGKAYDWLHKEVGFYPLFLAVGKINDILMTGYDSNFRIFPDEPSVNYILFTFDFMDGVVFQDYEAWHYVLGDAINLQASDLNISNHVRRMIFKKSWGINRWLKLAHFKCEVQAVVPKIDLRLACRVCCKNLKTKRYLEKLGFQNVQVKKISPSW